MKKIFLTVTLILLLKIPYAQSPFKSTISESFSRVDRAKLDTAMLIYRATIDANSTFHNLMRGRNISDSIRAIRDSILTANGYSMNVSSTAISEYLLTLNEKNIILDETIKEFKCSYYFVNYSTSNFDKTTNSFGVYFYPGIVQNLSSLALAKLILYTVIQKDNHPFGGNEVRRKALAWGIADVFNFNYNIIPSTPNSGSAQYGNAKSTSQQGWFFVDMEQYGKMVPYYIYLETKLKDVANIISGSEGKLRSSKVDLKFIAPGIDLSVPVSRIDTNVLSLQVGGGINFKEPITEIVNKKPNFDIKFNAELVYMNKAHYGFKPCEKMDYLKLLYSSNYSNNQARRDSFMLNAPWNTKMISFWTGRAIGKWQRLNMIDSLGNMTDTASQHSSGAFTLSINYQFYHFVSPKNHFLAKGGNKYLKLGFDMSYNNAVANETATGVKVQSVDTTADGKKNKVSNEQVAYNELDVIEKHFTFSPHFDYYVMENTRHFGVHFLSEVKMIHLGAGIWDNQLKLGIGLFGSVKNSLSTNGNVVNFELLFTAQNPIQTNISTYFKSFVPALKLEFPFNQLKN